MDTEDIPLGGHWGLTIVMVVIASWILYKYVAPKSFKEWRNAGLVQAFIIALYAEMYGFPLTIYVLTSFLGMDIPWLHMKGHLWATLLGLGDTGAMVEMIIGFVFVFAGLALIFNGWRLIYRAQKKDELATHGVYRHIRHPQYTGIFLVIFGQLVHWPTVLTLLLFPVIVWAYYRLSRREERVMISKFGERYLNYMEEAPMFFPKIGHWRLLLKGS
ncbi:MAG: isoprenylcysteine carboxylmethyltransferase family protein [Desulfobacterales bacterium]|nr:isoprenylcysteine carboxylmethyltransferase family protein [Desulfobacterales bacterium]